jgi:trehalose 6-phosphate phosphatase
MANEPPPPPVADWAWFLDVDGTLVEIAARPDAVRAEPRMLAALEALVRAAGGAVALVSGRAIAVLDRLFAPLQLPTVGLHGLERRDARGRLHRAPARDPAIEAAAPSFEDFAARHPGTLLEHKGLTVALHFRAVPEAADAAVALARALADGSAGRIVVQRGKMVVELRPAGSDKGDAVAAFAAEPPFAGRLPVFIGDDVTDESAFAAVNRMGGHSIRIGGADVPTAARWRIETVAGLIAWIESLPPTGRGAEAAAR